MTNPTASNEVPKFSFLKGAAEFLPQGDAFDWEVSAGKVRDELGEALNAKNVAFLLGSGCSSFAKEGKEMGIPTMAPLGKEFLGSVGSGKNQVFPNASERSILKNSLGVDLAKEGFAANLERLMEVLFSARHVLVQSGLPKHQSHLKAVESVIGKLQRFIVTKCSNGEFSAGSSDVMQCYHSFYRKLVFRDRSLSRPWVFTTNYDLFNETAMDQLGIPYANGFAGTVERRFNPATFRYTLAEQLDLTNRKWTAVDGFVYLAKLHGSINWTEDEHGLLRIRELPNPTGDARVMIYPTPTKQNASLGTPYSDLFREFQGRIVREQSVLFSIGYSFGDEHINNIIYQALTVPTFKLVVFADPKTSGEIAKLRKLGDPRIWIIGGQGVSGGQPAHYFQTVVEKFLPHLPSDRIDTAVEKVISTLFAAKEGAAS